MTLQFQNNRLVIATREELPGVAVRPLRQVVGVPGLYHRITGAAGEVLFENVVPDPRRVPWDTTDDGKKLRGGVARLDDLPVVLRLPAGVHGRLQVFEIKSANWSHSTLDKDGQLVGEFEL